MYHLLSKKVINLVSPTPVSTPVHHSTPSPSPSSSVSSALFGSGFASVLVILLILVLLGVIAWIAWMFMTGRWLTAQAAMAKGHPVNNRSNAAAYPVLPPSANSPWAVPPAYPPGRTTPPIVSMEEQAKRGPEVSSSDELLNNRQWMRLVEENVRLFDELDGLFPQPGPRQEVANHVMLRLQEILGRSGVEVLSHERTYDPDRHQLVQSSVVARVGTPIVKIVSPGFAVGPRLLRPARVLVTNVSADESPGNM
jgi:hypothetical protein